MEYCLKLLNTQEIATENLSSTKHASTVSCQHYLEAIGLSHSKHVA